MKTLTIGAAALALTLGFAGTSSAQQPGSAAAPGVTFQAGPGAARLGPSYQQAQVAPGAYGMMGAGQQMGAVGIGGPGIPGAGIGGVGSQGTLAAPIPQYWLADAAIFTSSASKTASVLENEPSLEVQAPHIVGSQAAYLVNTTSRALADLNALFQTAQQNNPDVVPQIRNAMTELLSAQALGHQLVMASSRGALPPNYQATIRSANQHLQRVQPMLNDIAKRYRADRFTRR